MSKKLFAFDGTIDPDAAFCAQYHALMEQQPFDGLVYQNDWEGNNLAQSPWQPHAFTPAEVQAAETTLQAVKWTTFTENFFRFRCSPGTVDYFDDFGPVVSNAKLAAEFARTTGAKGILLDTEAYHVPVWWYAMQKYADTKSWSQYVAQVRQRGSEVMEAMQAGYPGLTVILTFAWSKVWIQQGRRPGWTVDDGRIKKYGNALMVPFCDGLLAAQTGTTRLIDGYEQSYPFDDPKRFDTAALEIRAGCLPLVQDQAKYRQVVEIGFGLMLDNTVDAVGAQRLWHTSPTRFDLNYYTPVEFEASLTKALAVSDEYVWIYSETPRFWSSRNGQPYKLPAAYTDAIRRAKASA